MQVRQLLTAPSTPYSKSAVLGLLRILEANIRRVIVSRVDPVEVGSLVAMQCHTSRTALVTSPNRVVLLADWR